MMLAAVTTLTRLTTEPWERSSPALRIATVCPPAKNSSDELCISTFVKLRRVRKFGLNTEYVPSMARKAASNPTRSHRNSPRRILLGDALVTARVSIALRVSSEDRIPEHPLVVEPIARHLSNDLPAAHDQQPVAEPQDLIQFGRNDDDRRAGLGQLINDSMNLALPPNIDAPGRLVEQQDRGIGTQPLGHNDLLLIAARERHGLGEQRRRHHAQAAAQVRGSASFRPQIQPEQPAEAGKRGQGDTGEDRAH